MLLKQVYGLFTTVSWGTILCLEKYKKLVWNRFEYIYIYIKYILFVKKNANTDEIFSHCFLEYRMSISNCVMTLRSICVFKKNDVIWKLLLN